MLKKIVLFSLVVFLVLNLGFAAGGLGDITALIDDLFKNDIIGVDESTNFLYGVFILFCILFVTVIFAGSEIIFIFFILVLSIISLTIFGFFPLWVGILTGILAGLFAGVSFIIRMLGQ